MGKVFASTPKIESAIETEDSSEEDRKKALERQRRGLEGTIKTSYSGILTQSNSDLSRKNLLGE